MSKNLKITYFGKFQKDPYSGLFEAEISKALKKLGHKVFEFDVMMSDPKKIIEQANKSDLFLFHNGGIGGDQLSVMTGIRGMTYLLSQITCPKVFWNFDRVIAENEMIVSSMLPLVRCGFLNDDTWARRNKHENAFGLHAGCSERPLGEYKKEYDFDVVFIGRNWGGREEIIQAIKKQYGRNFKHFENVWGKDFDDICASAKVIVQPKWLMNDFIWTDQIYHVLSAGGFLIHPRLYGLKEEGFEDGNQYIGYTQFEEMMVAIDFFLKPETFEKKKQVIENGRNFVLQNFKWENRVGQMLNVLREKLLC